MLPGYYDYILIAAFLISASAGLYAFLYRKLPGSKIGGALIIHGALWTFFYILQIYSTTYAMAIFFYKLQTIFNYFVPTLFSLYLFSFFEIKMGKYKHTHIFLAVIPSAAAIQILLNDPWGLIWNSMHMHNYNQIHGVLGIFSELVIAYNHLHVIIWGLYFVYTLTRPKQMLKIRVIAYLISIIIYMSAYTIDRYQIIPYQLLISPFVFNILSSAIMLMKPESLYKRDVLPYVHNLVIDNVSNPVLVTDNNDNVIYLNQIAKTLLNIENVDFLQNKLGSIFTKLITYIENKKEDDIKYFEFNKRFYELDIHNIRDWQNTLRSVIYVLNDVTEHVNYTNNLETLVAEKTEELKISQRMAAIGETAAMVGHDLRNPLQVVVSATGYINRLISKVENGELEHLNDVRKRVHKIDDQILYMNKIVSDLQMYSKPLCLDVKEVKMSEYMDEIISDLVISDAITVSNRLEDCFVGSIDIDLMRRVFLNLMNNAIQAMSGGGSLEISCCKNDGFVEVWFTDSGVGISEDNMKDIFTPLFTTKAKGTGLGLPVCKRIVEAHNGRIEVVSKVGIGSTFKIIIPYSEKGDTINSIVQPIEDITLNYNEKSISEI